MNQFFFMVGVFTVHIGFNFSSISYTRMLDYIYIFYFPLYLLFYNLSYECH